MNTQRSDEADCGGVGVLGDVGTEADDVAGAGSGSVSAMLRKVNLCGGSLSSGTGWPFRVPEVDFRSGRIPGDLRVYTVFLGCTKNDQEAHSQYQLHFTSNTIPIFKHTTDDTVSKKYHHLLCWSTC